MKFCKKNNLAFYGGSKIIKNNFKNYNSIGKEEFIAASKVIKSGKLSAFIAGDGKNSQGGYYVNKFENYLARFYNVKHAITLNSWTSGLIAAVGAIDVSPGDEIITTPWSMCASATAILHWNAIPVFADIDKRTFNIDPNEIKKKITKKTVAIIAADIFGQSCDIDGIKKIIKGSKIKLITDSAQSPYSFYKKKITGTQSDIGGFSLNYHKHINTGEGGVVVTNSNLFARKVRLIRNHAEASLKNNSTKKLINMLGYNFRMGEIEAAIGIEQYKKLKSIIKNRNIFINLLNKKLKKIPFLSTPNTYDSFSHNYYVYPILLDWKKIKYSRSFIVKCLKAEGLQGLVEGYTNIHLLPMYQKKIAYGAKGFPWSIYNNKVNYKKGICPVAEEMHDKSFIGFKICLFKISIKEVDLIFKTFEKVWKILKIY
jgi:dTDP-4-amino-4,6-dideoxygalactose transaminase